MRKKHWRRALFSDESGSLDRARYIIAMALLVLAFLMAGSGRDDIISLLLWRPLTAFLFALSIVMSGAEAWRCGKGLLVFVASILILVVSHLVPLPPDLWTSLPGRKILKETYEVVGIKLPWQPLSMAQARTWNALFSLFAPIALLVTVLALDRRRNQQLLHLLLIVGFTSGVIGVLQALGPSNSLLYFYRISNYDVSVGLFANRNHQAAFLSTMYPLLAARLSLFKGTPDRLFFHRSMAMAGACLLVPLILMTGSRAGIVLGGFGIILAWWVYSKPFAQGRVVGVRGEHRSRIVGVGFILLLLVVVAIVAVRTPALRRLVETDAASELRVQAFPVIMQAVAEFFPFGSGIGTFVEGYKIFEPDSFVSPNYLNHAHNDLIELLMTGGLPAGLLIIWAVILGAMALFALIKCRKIKPDEPGFAVQVLGRAGFAVLVMLALASLVDYPLRVPSLMLYAVVAAAWCSNAYRSTRKNL